MFVCLKSSNIEGNGGEGHKCLYLTRYKCTIERR